MQGSGCGISAIFFNTILFEASLNKKVSIRYWFSCIVVKLRRIYYIWSIQEYFLRKKINLLKHTITILLIFFSLRIAGQSKPEYKYIINFDAAYTGSFIEDVYQYQPALAYSIGLDYYWNKQLFSGLKFTTMQTEVVPEWDGFEPYLTRNNLLQFESGISFKSDELIFISSIHAGVGFYYLDEFTLQTMSDYGSVELTYYDDYAVAPVIGLEGYFGYRIGDNFSIGLTLSESYVYQKWNIEVTGSGIETTVPVDYATTNYTYAQSMINIAGGIKIIFLL